MYHEYLLLAATNVFVLLLGVAIGRSIFVLKMRHEENRKRELELALLEKRSQVLKEGKKIAGNLKELIYKANIQKEIDKLTRKDRTG